MIGALKSLHVVFKQMSLLYFKLRVNFVQEVVSVWLKEQNISISVDTGVPFRDYRYLYICVCVCVCVCACILICMYVCMWAQCAVDTAFLGSMPRPSGSRQRNKELPRSFIV